MEPEDARTALDEVRTRDHQVRTDLARQRPLRWATLSMVAGYYLALAGLDFPPPVPLLTLVPGAALLFAGHFGQSRGSANAGVRQRRDTWRPRNLVLTAGWLLGLAAAYALTRLLLKPFVAEGLTSVLAAIPSALLFAAMAAWLYRLAYGPHPADGQTSTRIGNQ